MDLLEQDKAFNKLVEQWAHNEIDYKELKRQSRILYKNEDETTWTDVWNYIKEEIKNLFKKIMK